MYFSIVIWYFLGTRTTVFTDKWHLYPPSLSKCNIYIGKGSIAFKFYTEVKNMKLEAATSFWGKIWVFLKNFVKFLQYMQVKCNRAR